MSSLWILVVSVSEVIEFWLFLSFKNKVGIHGDSFQIFSNLKNSENYDIRCIYFTKKQSEEDLLKA